MLIPPVVLVGLRVFSMTTYGEYRLIEMLLEWPSMVAEYHCSVSLLERVGAGCDSLIDVGHETCPSASPLTSSELLTRSKLHTEGFTSSQDWISHSDTSSLLVDLNSGPISFDSNDL